MNFTRKGPKGTYCGVPRKKKSSFGENVLNCSIRNFFPSVVWVVILLVNYLRMEKKSWNHIMF